METTTSTSLVDSERTYCGPQTSLALLTHHNSNSRKVLDSYTLSNDSMSKQESINNGLTIQVRGLEFEEMDKHFDNSKLNEEMKYDNRNPIDTSSSSEASSLEEEIDKDEIDEDEMLENRLVALTVADSIDFTERVNSNKSPIQQQTFHKCNSLPIITSSANEQDKMKNITEISEADANKDGQAKEEPMKKAFSCNNLSRAENGKKSVCFTDITVRNYPLTLGDHPDCSYGPPVTLDWEYEEYDTVNLDEYEESRAPRRTTRQMVLNYYHRKYILEKAGYSENDLKRAVKHKDKAKRNRNITRALLPVTEVEFALETAGRKIKKVVNEKKKGRSSSFVVNSGRRNSLELPLQKFRRQSLDIPSTGQIDI